MPDSDSKTCIVNDQLTETDALDFTLYVKTLADIIQTGIAIVIVSAVLIAFSYFGKKD